MQNQAKQVIALVVVVVAAELVDLALGGRLDHWGILPRTAGGLVGIPLAPFLHGDFAHLAANAVPLLILGSLASLARTPFLVLTAEIVVLGGLGVWLVGREAYHIGASGLVFGYFGFVLARGWFERSFVAVAAALGTGVLYSGLLFGVLPGSSGVSWESHLCGALAGVALAAGMARPGAATSAPGIPRGGRLPQPRRRADR